MRQLTYISSTRPRYAIDLPEILSVSRRNNIRDSLTGLLLFDGTRFLQTLEGDPVILEWAFKRIGADPRHRALVVLSDRHVDQRQFGRWAMACQEVFEGDADSMIARVDQLTELVSDRNVQSHFRSFARLQRRAA